MAADGCLPLNTTCSTPNGERQFAAKHSTHRRGLGMALGAGAGAFAEVGVHRTDVIGEPVGHQMFESQEDGGGFSFGFESGSQLAEFLEELLVRHLIGLFGGASMLSHDAFLMAEMGLHVGSEKTHHLA